MSRILVVTEWAPPSAGIARHSGFLVDEWIAAGHEVLILAPTESSPLGDEDRSDTFRVRRVLTSRLSASTRQLIDEFQPDHVIVQFSFAALRAATFGALALVRHCADLGAHVAIICHEASRDTGRTGLLGRSIYRRLAKLDVDPIAFVESEREVLEGLGFQRIRLMPHGVALQPDVGAAQRARVNHEIAHDRPLVMAYGYIHPHKGFETFVSAANLVGTDDVTFLLAGQVRQRRGVFRWFGRIDTEYGEKLNEQIRSSACATRFERLGFVEDQLLSALLQSAAVVVLPYREISQSGVAAELLANGSAVVATDLPGLRAMLASAAHFVPVENPAALAKAIEELLASPSEQATLRQRALERRAQTSFSATAALLLNEEG